MNFQFSLRRDKPEVKIFNFQINKKKFFEVFIYLLVFFLPWQTRWIIEAGKINGGASEFLTKSLYAFDVLLIVLLLVATAQFFSLKRFKFEISALWQKKYFKLIAVFIFWNVLSILWAENKPLAIEHVGWILLAVGFAFLVNRYGNKFQLMFWFVASLTLSAWLGIWQFFFQYAFANKWLGLAGHDPALPGTSIVEFYASDGVPIRWLRAYGSFDHPNVFGAMMAIGIIFTIWLIIEKEKNNKLENIILYSSLVSFAIGFFVSFSRSAWLGLFFGMLAILVVFLRQKLFGKFFKFGKLSLLVVLIFLSMIFLYPAQFSMRSVGEGRLEQKSVNERGVYLQQGLQIISQNKFLGVGAGNYVESLKENDSSEDAWVYQPVHNVALLAWAELGFLGFLLVISLVILSLAVAWQSEIFALGLGLALLPSLMLDHWLWSLHSGILLVGFIIGIILSKIKK